MENDLQSSLATPRHSSHFPFLLLPIERKCIVSTNIYIASDLNIVRFHIYRLHLGSRVRNYGWDVHLEKSKQPEQWEKASRYYVSNVDPELCAMLGVCRQIRLELLPFFWQMNSIRVSACSPWSIKKYFYTNIRRIYLQFPQNVPGPRSTESVQTFHELHSKLDRIIWLPALGHIDIAVEFKHLCQFLSYIFLRHYGLCDFDCRRRRDLDTEIKRFCTLENQFDLVLFRLHTNHSDYVKSVGKEHKDAEGNAVSHEKATSGCRLVLCQCKAAVRNMLLKDETCLPKHLFSSTNLFHAMSYSDEFQKDSDREKDGHAKIIHVDISDFYEEAEITSQDEIRPKYDVSKVAFSIDYCRRK